MNYGSFKSYENFDNKKSNLIFGTGRKQVNIKVAQLATFGNSDTKQQGYYVTEVNKLISTMLTGWDDYGNKPKSMSNNYVELILSCDNGFVVKKRLQFPHIIAWQNDSTQYNIPGIYAPFSIDNWLKADDFQTPDITLAIEPMNEIITTSGDASASVNEDSGRFYLYYRNLPVGVNRIHIEFHIKTKTEPIDFDLEVTDGMSWKDAQVILASNDQARINVLLGTVKDVYKFTGAEGNFEEITMHEWSALYQQIINLKPNNKFTHDLFFYLPESEVNADSDICFCNVGKVPDYSALPLLCGQPPILYGEGTPQESVVPLNWKQFDPVTNTGYNWTGTPLALGQVYINISATSNGRYTAIPDVTNPYNLKWINF